MSLPVVAVVGRPNVGKSTLFNRLVGFKKAVVHDRPGVTRDRLYEEAELLDRRVLLIDTGGIEPSPDTELLAAIRAQTLVAVDEADVIVFVVDGPKGLTVADEQVADELRRTTKPVVLAVNKLDGERHDALLADFWQLGLDEPLPISAGHGRGIYELVEAVCRRLPPRTAAEDVEEGEDAGGAWLADAEEDAALGHAAMEAEEGLDAPDEEPAPDAPIRIAVIGRPNLGKSTLVNRLLGAERHLVLDMPGTTTDPVDSPLEVEGRRYVLVDTAGVRRRARIDDPLERFVSLRSIRAIERCHVALLVLDGVEGPTDQDARLASLVLDRGRGLVVLVNRWDLARESDGVSSHTVEDAIARHLTHIPWAPRLFISAKTGKGCHRILPLVDEVFANFGRRIPTAKLNRFLAQATGAYAAPQKHHHPVKLYYMTQTRVRPPTFAVFANLPDALGPAYQRYLTNQLRVAFPFEGTPLRLHLKRRRRLGEEPGA